MQQKKEKRKKNTPNHVTENFFLSMSNCSDSIE